mmetsp:Transcript_156886/g.481238  ORF Transcript_156886/g.481238 Transcript_156886/m.481238 type:complete len:139 (-) Transcript_156886:15-431(-)
MRHRRGAAAAVAWTLSCYRAAGQEATSPAISTGPSTPVATTGRPRLSDTGLPVLGDDAGAGEDALLLELEPPRRGIRGRGLMGDQAALSFGGLAALAVVAAGGFYRYRQRRSSAPPPQVVGRLLEDDLEMTNPPGISG